jgi:hypothetical protein
MRRATRNIAVALDFFKRDGNCHYTAIYHYRRFAAPIDCQVPCRSTAPQVKA